LGEFVKCRGLRDNQENTLCGQKVKEAAESFLIGKLFGKKGKEQQTEKPVRGKFSKLGLGWSCRKSPKERPSENRKKGISNNRKPTTEREEKLLFRSEEKEVLRE